MAQQLPSSNCFIVRPADDKKAVVTEHLSSIGEVEKLPDENLLLLQTQQAAATPEAAWHDVREALGETVSVQPVLLDETGEAHFPTGEVTVRFHKAPTDEELKEFASRYRLSLRDRNEFMPQQVVFNPTHPNQSYLPKLVEEIAGQDGVKRAWANTLSHYKRSSK